MPKVSGKDIISDTTEKVIRRTVVFSSITALVKLYNVPLNDLKLLGMELPAALFDVVLLALVVYFTYSLIINWAGDLLAFRLWYRDSSIWSQFGTQMKLDKRFISGGIQLLLRLYHLEKNKEWPTDFNRLDEETREEYTSFKTNVELYCTRLENAGTKFSVLSCFGHYYVWIQSFLFPIGLSLVALYLLMKYGSFTLPPNF